MKQRTVLIISAFLAFAIGCGDEVKMVEVEPVSFNFKKKSQSQQCTAKAMDIRGMEVSGVGFTWSSENTAVATVSSDGLVKPAGNGSTAIVAKTKEGKTSEAFVKVCLPKEMLCDPSDELKVKVGTVGPIICHVTDCNDEIIPSSKIEMSVTAEKLLLKDEPTVNRGKTSTPFTGLMVGETSVDIKSGEFEHSVKVQIDEQTFLPGMGPSSGGGGGGGGKKKKSNDPYGDTPFDHILKNM